MYQAPLRDLRFVMQELLGSENVLVPAYSEIDYSGADNTGPASGWGIAGLRFVWNSFERNWASL